MKRRSRLCAAMLVLGAAVIGTTGAGVASRGQEGGILRLAVPLLDSVDPALSYSSGGWALLDTTCARLMTYPDKPAPEGLRVVPEVAADFPRISRNAKTYTFTLRRGFRFSDGTPVQASAFARAINRILALGDRSGGSQFTGDIVGAADVQAGRTSAAAGVVARGYTLTIRFTRPTVDFAAKSTMPFFCAVPPGLPVDPEGVGAYPGSGPYTIVDYRPGERVTIRRNRFYRGNRPHHVDGFDVDLRAAIPPAVLRQVDQGAADWADIAPGNYFDSGFGLAAKYGVNRSQFFVKPGSVLFQLVFNLSRPVFGDNPRLRRAVNFALDRQELRRAANQGSLSQRLTDQFLPPTFPGFTDANIYPLENPSLTRARELASGNVRGGKATLYVPNAPHYVSISRLVTGQLAEIGLDVEVEFLPFTAYFRRLSTPGEPWDIAPTLWGADFADPSSYINQLFDGRFSGITNLGRFDSPELNRAMRKAARLTGAARYRAYAELDVRLARDAAPSAPLAIFNQPTLVSKRVGCVVLRPALDLTAACIDK